MLLLVKLRELVRKRQALAGVDALDRDAPVDRVEVRLSDLVDAARVHGISRIDDFLTSDLFKRGGFSFDAQRAILVRNF